MKILKKVNVREVKRTFVIANGIRIQKSGRRYLNKISREEFLKEFQQSKQKGLQMTDSQLGKRLEYAPRLRAYDASDWYLGEVATNEVGVWERAGGLPLPWTNGSLQETADKVRDALGKYSRSLTKRARYAVSNMLATNVDLLQKEKYLLPIIFKGNTGTRGRRRLKRVMAGDIDDGCMRSIALAVNGAKVIRAYIGFPKKVKAVQ
ncbi:MAG: hypothetical protein WCS97_00845 [Candidatus Paceibacterota bacterium]|jgi:hypothetical protein